MEEINKLFKSFKLGNTTFFGNVKITHELINDVNVLNHEKSYNIDIKKEIIYKMVEQLSSEIINKHQSSIKLKEKNKYDEKIHSFDEYNIELMVMKLEDFKIIVEAVIGVLNDDQINKIKEGQNVL